MRPCAWCAVRGSVRRRWRGSRQAQAEERMARDVEQVMLQARGVPRPPTCRRAARRTTMSRLPNRIETKIRTSGDSSIHDVILHLLLFNGLLSGECLQCLSVVAMPPACYTMTLTSSINQKKKCNAHRVAGAARREINLIRCRRYVCRISNRHTARQVPAAPRRMRRLRAVACRSMPSASARRAATARASHAH